MRQLLSTLVAVVLLAAIAQMRPPGLALAAEGPIRIASIFAKTGPGAEENFPNYRVVQLAVKVVNESGGVLGRPMEVVEFDTKSTPIGARQAALDAVAAGVAAVIGPSWSSQAMAMGAVFQEAGIPMLGTTTTAPEVTRIGDYIFRVCYTDAIQAAVLERFAREQLKVRTAAVVNIAGDVYSEGLSKVFIQLFTSKGGEILTQIRYLQSAMDFTAQVDAVQAAAPDLVFLPGYSRDSGLFLKQARGRGLAMPFLGGDGWTGLENYTHLSPAQGDNYYVSHWHPKAGSEASRAFMQLLQREYKGDFGKIDAGNANAYDALGLLADAIRRAGRADPAAIRDALMKTERYQGVSGEITFKGSRDPVKPLVVLKLSQSGVEYVRTMEPGP